MLTIDDDPKIAGDPGDIMEKDIQRARQYVISNQVALMALWSRYQDVGYGDFTWNKV